MSEQGLPYAGLGRSGLAILGYQESEKEAFSREPLRSLAPIWKAIHQDEMDGVLRACLVRYGETPTPKLIERRTAEFLALCDLDEVKCIVPVGTKALKQVSHIYGKATKLIGATIQSGGRFVVPIDTQYSGERSLRSHMWTENLARFVRRAAILARGGGQLFTFPASYIGEGADVERALETILSEKKPIGVDLETAGRNHLDSVFTAMGIASDSIGVSVPWHGYASHLYGNQAGLQNSKIRELVITILRDADIIKLFHNGQFDLTMLAAKGIDVQGPCHDTLVAHRVIYPDLYHNLQFCMGQAFAVSPWKTVFEQTRKAAVKALATKSKCKELGVSAKDLTGDWAEFEPRTLMQYNANDAQAEAPLWARLSSRLDDVHRGWEQYNDRMRLGLWAARAQAWGVRIDQAAVAKTRKVIEARIAEVEGRWNADTGGLIPLSGKGSTAAMEHYFYRSLKAPRVRSTSDKSDSLGSSVLLDYDSSPSSSEKLANAAFTLFEYRKIKKAYDAFMLPLKDTDRVYARPNINGTKGTRLSYSDPNLQQWSKEKEIKRLRTDSMVQLAPNLRDLIVPDRDHVFIELDYSGLEARLVAYAAKIGMWLDWMDTGKDLHIENAFLMFGKRLNKKDPGDAKLRQVIKTLTYARFYNSKKSVGQVLRMLKPTMPTLTESYLHEVFEAFDKGIPHILQWQESVEAFVRKHGYVEVEIGGQRQQHDKRRPDMNQALSVGIQSCAGNIANGALARLDARLDPERGERVAVQVHDAFIIQCRLDRVRDVWAMTKEEMERPVNIFGNKNVVLPTEGGWGLSWKDAKHSLEELP